MAIISYPACNVSLKIFANLPTEGCDVVGKSGDLDSLLKNALKSPGKPSSSMDSSKLTAKGTIPISCASINDLSMYAVLSVTILIFDTKSTP